MCGRPTRPWLARPWTRSPWISCCLPASTSRWTYPARPQSSTSSWWVLLCISHTQTLPYGCFYRVAASVSWEYFLWVYLSIGPTSHWWPHYVSGKVVQKKTLSCLRKYTVIWISQWDVVLSHMTTDIHWTHWIVRIKQTKPSWLCAEIPSAGPQWREAIIDALA